VPRGGRGVRRAGPRARAGKARARKCPGGRWIGRRAAAHIAPTRRCGAWGWGRARHRARPRARRTEGVQTRGQAWGGSKNRQGARGARRKRGVPQVVSTLMVPLAPPRNFLIPKPQFSGLPASLGIIPMRAPSELLGPAARYHDPSTVTELGGRLGEDTPRAPVSPRENNGNRTQDRRRGVYCAQFGRFRSSHFAGFRMLPKF
jgi:hypothetical protein